MTPEEVRAVFAPIFGDVIQGKTVGAALNDLCRVVRQEVLEEAAKVADEQDSLRQSFDGRASAAYIAAAIRSLKGE
jgi:ubiquinone biosynthesis protein UbiJ